MVRAVAQGSDGGLLYMHNRKRVGMDDGGPEEVTTFTTILPAPISLPESVNNPSMI